MEQERRDLTKWKFRWRKIHNWTEALAKLIYASGGVLAFAAAAYDDEHKVLSVAAGCCTSVAFALSSYSVYAQGESNERAAQLVALDPEIEELNV